jgi:hypothetical protein
MNAAEQFANDYLLVIENDREAWDDALQSAREHDHNVVALSDDIRKQWETLVDDIALMVNDKNGEVAGLIIRQTLQGWGSTPFDLIARHIITTSEEILNG